MSVVTKEKRFVVRYKGGQHFFNTTGAASALAMARTKLIRMAVLVGKPDGDLGSLETFSRIARAKESLRW